MASRADLAAVVEQPVVDIFPDRVVPVELHGIEPLDLDPPETPEALDPEELARSFAQSHLAEVQPWLPGGARVSENGSKSASSKSSKFSCGIVYGQQKCRQCWHW